MEKLPSQRSERERLRCCEDKFVLGENISQTASFVVSGSADVGIVALSLALSPNMKDKGRYTAVAPDDSPRLSNKPA
jgi:molybdate transport system substrate-binding protein